MAVQPKVTIVIPTYNAARWVGKAIQSALDQSFADFELLVFDNASTDDTPDVIARFDDPRLTYTYCDENVGFAGNVTRGIRAARGEYFMVLGADDILGPAFLDVAVARLDESPGASMFHCGAIWIDDDDNPIGAFDGNWPGRTDGDDAFLLTFTEGFCYSCVISRTAPVKALGAMDEAWGMISDTWLVLKLCLAGEVLFDPRALVRYRVRESSLSFELYADGKMFSDHMAGLRDAFSWPESAHLAARRAEAERAVAMQAIDTIHLARLGAGLSGYFRKSAQVLSASPGVLTQPRAWLRLGFGLLPAPVIRRLRRSRAEHRIDALAESQGAAS